MVQHIFDISFLYFICIDPLHYPFYVYKYLILFLIISHINYVLFIIHHYFLFHSLIVLMKGPSMSMLRYLNMFLMLNLLYQTAQRYYSMFHHLCILKMLTPRLFLILPLNMPFQNYLSGVIHYPHPPLINKMMICKLLKLLHRDTYPIPKYTTLIHFYKFYLPRNINIMTEHLIMLHMVTMTHHNLNIMGAAHMLMKKLIQKVQKVLLV